MYNLSQFDQSIISSFHVELCKHTNMQKLSLLSFGAFVLSSSLKSAIVFT